MIRALGMAAFEIPLVKELKYGELIGKKTPWWNCKHPGMDIEDDCPMQCSEKRPFEVAPGLWVCRACFDLELS